jgi:hypothetical protein
VLATSILVSEGDQAICAEAGEQARVEIGRYGINLVFQGVMIPGEAKLAVRGILNSRLDIMLTPVIHIPPLFLAITYKSNSIAIARSPTVSRVILLRATLFPEGGSCASGRSPPLRASVKAEVVIASLAI